MLCGVIRQRTLEGVCHEVQQLRERVDILEIRLDALEQIGWPQLLCVCQQLPLPHILTWKARELTDQVFDAMLATKPYAIDIEREKVRPEHLERMGAHGVVPIVSDHDYAKTPQELCLYPGDRVVNKLAYRAHNIADTLRLLHKVSHTRHLGVSMGLWGECSRLLPPILGLSLSYTSLQGDRALGQLGVEELESIYGYSRLNPHTRVYGLIGYPLEKSRGIHVHNQWMQEAKRDAVYLNFPVQLQDLDLFFSYLPHFPIDGLSVTMPLKQAVIAYVDRLDSQAQQMGSVNTIVKKQGQLWGYNTDGVGAWNALAEHVNPCACRVLILGIGGSARAIAFEGMRRKAVCVLWGRDAHRAQKVARELGCQATRDMRGCYDVVVNATPVSIPLPQESIKPQGVVMDIAHRDTYPLARVAQRAHATFLDSSSMFFYQAQEQFRLWFS